MSFRRLLPVFAVLIPAVIGCQDAVDPRIADLQKQLLLTRKPAETVTVSSIRADLKQENAPSETDVVIFVRINAGDLPPWEPGKAAFMGTDATGHEGEEDHDPYTCPFCSRNIEDYQAWIRFCDKSGEIIDIDSRELLDVKEKQLVVVRGKASLDDQDYLIVQADGIYVVPAKGS